MPGSDPPNDLAKLADDSLSSEDLLELKDGRVDRAGSVGEEDGLERREDSLSDGRLLGQEVLGSLRARESQPGRKVSNST